MRPVNKGSHPGTKFSEYGKYKPLIAKRIGAYCSYCDRHKDLTDLHVEHIYPQVSHNSFSLRWRNFLLACITCNTYKRLYQGTIPQKGLLKKALWPHIDNTAAAYIFDNYGGISVSNIIPPASQLLAQETLRISGLIKSPGVAQSYRDLGLDYDIVSKRSTTWKLASSLLVVYEERPNRNQEQAIALQAKGEGFLGVWLQVFHQHANVKLAIVSAFQADQNCFDASGNSKPAAGTIAPGVPMSAKKNGRV